ncbi:MAG: hypothetical protein QNJ97_11740 [Myxococcota bacterium]|nr:hypothetical protein [Myxococcota bacterium]
MSKAVIAITVLLSTSFAAIERGNCAAGVAKDASSPVSRKDVEKTYATIAANLKPKARTRLTVAVTNFYESLLAVDFRSVDTGRAFYSMAKTETKKLFCLATAKQLEALVFYALITALKKVEGEIAALGQDGIEASTWVDSLNIKALLLMESAGPMLKRLTPVRPRSIQKIL